MPAPSVSNPPKYWPAPTVPTTADTRSLRLAKVEAKGAALRILAMNLDTATPTGRLMLNLLASVAEFERTIKLESQQLERQLGSRTSEAV